MVFYVGRRYTATVRGSRTKHVTCEGCGHRYQYQVESEGSGTGESAYFLNNEGAQQRARERAQASLDSRLERAREAVACPRCGLFQAYMVALLRQRRFGWLNVIGWVVLVLGALFASLPKAGDPSLTFADRLVATPNILVLLSGLGLIALSLFGRRYLYHPNAKKRPSAAAQPSKGREIVLNWLRLRWLVAAAFIVSGVVVIALSEQSAWVLQEGRWFAILTYAMLAAALFYPIHQGTGIDSREGDRPRSKKGPASALELEYANVFAFMNEIDRERVISSYMARRACDREGAIAAAIDDWRKDNRSWR